MIKGFLILLILVAPMTGYAEQKYNPYENKWETVSDKSHEQAVLKYNPTTGKHHYAQPDAKLKYNPYENEWETVSDKPHEQAVLKYNPRTGKHQYAQPDAKLEYNPHENIWEYAR